MPEGPQQLALKRLNCSEILPLFQLAFFSDNDANNAAQGIKKKKKRKYFIDTIMSFYPKPLAGIVLVKIFLTLKY